MIWFFVRAKPFCGCDFYWYQLQQLILTSRRSISPYNCVVFVQITYLPNFQQIDSFSLVSRGKSMNNVSSLILGVLTVFVSLVRFNLLIIKHLELMEQKFVPVSVEIDSELDQENNRLKLLTKEGIYLNL